MKKIYLAMLSLVMVLSSAACGAPTLVGVYLGSTSDSLRYKTSVVVETPEGLRTGTSVREANLYTEPMVGTIGGEFCNIKKGEAVVIDLGSRGVLFALMGGQSEAVNIFTLFSGENKKQHVVLPKEQYPMFVHFHDIHDPKTVERVVDVNWSHVKLIREAHGPQYEMVDFKDVYGEGVKLKEIIVEMTDEDVTWEIEKVLPWLIEIHGGYLHGGFTSAGAPLGLHGGYFKTGDK